MDEYVCEVLWVAKLFIFLSSAGTLQSQFVHEGCSSILRAELGCD